MTVDADSVDALIHAITGLSFSEEEIAKNYDKIPPYLRIYEAEIAEKLRVVRTMSIIAEKLGSSKIKDTLVPKVDASINNGEDELLLEICQQLGNFPQHMERNSCVCLVPLLGRVLSQVEEVVVGEAAADALIRVIADLTAAQVDSICLPLIKSVFEDDLFCSSRRAGCRLIVPCYCKTQSADHKSELKGRLLNAASQEDEILLVREAAVCQLGQLAQQAAKDRPEILTSLVALSNDNHRDLRSASVRSLMQMIQYCNEKDLEAIVMPVLERYSEDAHRNTRQNFASQLAELQVAYNKIGKSPIFIRLWEDNEPEVRRATASNLAAFAEASPKELNGQLVPKLKEHLVNEHDERVRREIIAETVKLLPKLRKEDASEVVKTMVSLITDSGSAAAKQAVFDHLKDVLSDDSQVTSTILPAYVSWLRDQAHDIRQAAAIGLGRIVRDRKTLAEGLAKNSALASLATDGNYQFRKVWVLTAQELIENGPASCIPLLLPQLMKLSADKVPNVRMALVKALIRLAKHLDASVVKKDVSGPLAELIKDSDADVRFYADEALACLKK
uniref:TOG domain-containing protein n=1 Tax=Macrostomum lignano TaxID=282301 RepID=A0A1I8HZQ6_9PLAT